MIPDTTERVSSHTAEEVNRRIRAETEERLGWFAQRPWLIGERLGELDEEWDIERALEANASTLAFAGVVLGATVDRRWLAVPLVVTGFLFQHAIQGWCPPLPVLRRLGFRTASEIEEERMALKAIRGDFAGVEASGSKARAALEAAQT